MRPIELLDETGCLGPRTTIVHATHADGHELDLLAAAGARICVCPTTEANLGDGFLPVARVLHRGIGLCIGSDSNVRIDPLEELRELEGIARRQTGKRGVISLDALLAAGAAEGAAALGLDAWPDATIDLDAPAAARRRRGGGLRRLGLRLQRRRLVEDVGPVARPHEVRALGGRAVQAPRAVVREVAVAGAPPRRPRARSAFLRATR